MHGICLLPRYLIPVYFVREDDLRNQISELKRLGHLQKLRIEEEIKKSFELKQQLEALADKKQQGTNQ